MKKKFWLFGALTAVLLIAGVYSYLRFTPGGSLNPVRAEDKVQVYLNATAEEDIEHSFMRYCTPTTTAFEDSTQVAQAVWDSVKEEEYTFREVKSAGTEKYYIVSRGGVDLFQIRLDYQNHEWHVSQTEPTELTIQTHTLKIVVPSDSQVALNDKILDQSYITNANISYENLSEFDTRSPLAPCRVEYTIEGLYLTENVEVAREKGTSAAKQTAEDGVTCLSYLPADAGSYSFKISVPDGATATVNGVVLTDDYLVERTSYQTQLNLPQEITTELPGSSVYATDGLYLSPAISVIAADGTELIGAQSDDGTIIYSETGDAELYEAHHARVEEFLGCATHYGAGHDAYPYTYCVQDSDIYYYYTKAIYSLIWVQNVSLNIRTITTDGYIPLGEEYFICRGHVDCHTDTAFQSNDLSLSYEMLWQYTGNEWYLADLAFI